MTIILNLKIFIEKKIKLSHLFPKGNSSEKFTTIPYQVNQFLDSNVVENFVCGLGLAKNSRTTILGYLRNALEKISIRIIKNLLKHGKNGFVNMDFGELDDEPEEG